MPQSSKLLYLPFILHAMHHLCGADFSAVIMSVIFATVTN